MQLCVTSDAGDILLAQTLNGTQIVATVADIDNPIETIICTIHQGFNDAAFTKVFRTLIAVCLMFVGINLQ